MSRIIPALLATLAIAIGASGLVALGIGLFGAYGPWAPLFVVVPILGFGLFLLALQRLRLAQSVRTTNDDATDHLGAGTNIIQARRTASRSQTVSKVLGWGPGRVDIRMVHHAANPFCNEHLAGAIDGAATISIGGRVTYLYKRSASSPFCLFDARACDLATLTGLYHTYG